MKNSHIEWCDNTFNPWIGCRRVSEACKFCYIERAAPLRVRGMKLGDEPVRTSAAYWKQPLAWNREAERAYIDALHCTPAGQPCSWTRPRVFCLSLGDWLDDRVPIEWLADLLKLIHDTPNLDWQLLTKRPENWQQRLLFVCDTRNEAGTGMEFGFISQWVRQWVKGNIAPPNVWIGTTVENQARADERIPLLLSIPAKVRFLSCEPLLEEVSLDVVGQPGEEAPDGTVFDHIHWVICSGESGPHARPMHPVWARSLRDQCQAAGVPFFFKQWGEWAPHQARAGGDLGGDLRRGKVRHFRAEGENDGHFRKGDCYMGHVGKRAAGRLLSGREWNEFPRIEVSK